MQFLKLDSYTTNTIMHFNEYCARTENNDQWCPFHFLNLMMLPRRLPKLKTIAQFWIQIILFVKTYGMKQVPGVYRCIQMKQANQSSK